MPNVEFSLSGFDELAAKLKDPAVIGRVAEAVIKRATLEALTITKLNTPVDKHTLLPSIQSHFQGQGVHMQGIIGTNVKYAKWVNDGTGLYGPNHSLIYPKNAKVLRFTGSDGSVIFAKSIKGQKGKKFMQKGLAGMKAKLPQIYAYGMQVAHKEFGL